MRLGAPIAIIVRRGGQAFAKTIDLTERKKEDDIEAGLSFFGGRLFLAKILSGCEINSFEQFPQAQFCYNRSPCSASSQSSSEPSFASCAVDKVCC